MYFATVEFATPDYDQTVRLRTEELRLPLKLKFKQSQLAAEWKDIHFVGYDQNGALIACLVFSIIDDQTVKMRQVAVLKEVQGKGAGRRLVEASENWAKAQGYQHIIMHAREGVVPFYEKLGYQKIGKRFKEVNIPHFKMEKSL